MAIDGQYSEFDSQIDVISVNTESEPKIQKRPKYEFESQIENMLEKVLRIIHEGLILNEYLSDKEYAALSVMLKNIKTPLRTLRISQCSEKPLTSYALTQLLEENNSLESLYLEANQIDSPGIKAIADSLKQNKKLKTLYCGFVVKGLTYEAVQALAEMLLTNSSLKELNLYANKIDAGKTQILAETLAQNTALEKLGLASNEIGRDGAEAIANLLMKNKKLKELDLSDCRLGTDGIKLIFNALKQNKTLRHLKLSHLSPDAISILAEMLSENKGLFNLDLLLYTSDITAEQMQMLLQALKKNKSLQQFHIQDDDGKLRAEITEIKNILKNNAAQEAHASAAVEIAQ